MGKKWVYIAMSLCLGVFIHVIFSIPLFTPHESPGDFYIAIFYPHWSIIYFFGAQVFHAQAVSTSDIWWNVVVTCPASLCYGAAATFALIGAAKIVIKFCRPKAHLTKPR